MPKATFYRLSKEKQQQLLDAAKLEFSQRPFQCVNVTDLISRMGIATGSFYQYFEDKKDLYFYVLKSYSEVFRKQTEETNVYINFAEKINNMGRWEAFHTARMNDPLGKKIVVDTFTQALPNIRRDWYFDMVMGQGYMDLYDSSFIDSKPVAEICKENRLIIMAMLLSVRSVLDQFASRSEEPERYNKIYKMCLDIIKNGVFTIEDE